MGPFAGGIRTDTVRSAPDPRVGHGLGRATRPTGLGRLLDALRKALKAGKRLNRAIFDGSHNITFRTLPSLLSRSGCHRPMKWSRRSLQLSQVYLENDRLREKADWEWRRATLLAARVSRTFPRNRSLVCGTFRRVSGCALANPLHDGRAAALPIPYPIVRKLACAQQPSRADRRSAYVCRARSHSRPAASRSLNAARPCSTVP